MFDARPRSSGSARPPAHPRPSSSPPPLRPLWVTVYVCLLALVALAGLKTWRDLSVVEARAVELRQEIVRTEAEIDRLEHRLERLEDDPLALERLAREELQMTYPDEIVVVLPATSDEPAPTPTVPGPADPQR